MNINSKIARIPFFVLYLIMAILVSYNWIRVILFQKDFQAFRTEQPWDYHLSNFFVNNFGVTHQQYFLFALPVILLLLYAIPKIMGKLMGLDAGSNVKGDNHTAIILILLVAPVALGIYKFLGPGWKNHLLPGVILIILFSIWSWIDERKFKSQSGL
jgi:hypothetical protein